MNQAWWQQVESVFVAVRNHGVAGIVAALTSGHNLDVSGYEVHQFSFALVTPLRAKDDTHLVGARGMVPVHCGWWSVHQYTQSKATSHEVARSHKGQTQQHSLRDDLFTFGGKANNKKSMIVLGQQWFDAAAMN